LKTKKTERLESALEGNSLPHCSHWKTPSPLTAGVFYF